VTIAAAIAIAIGMRHAWQRVVAARLRAAVAGACIVVAAVANLAWEQTQQPHLALRPSLLADASVGRLPSIAREMVGRFGWLEFGLPEPTYWLWAGLVLVLAGVAVAVGRWRERIAIIGLIVGVAALIYAFHAVLLPETGFDAQGRYFLPIAVAVPLLAGETLMRRGLRLRAGVLTGLALGGTALAAAVQGLAWYVNARRYAVGTGGPRWFLGREQWVPPGGGWVVWLAVAGLGTACLVAAGIGSARPWGVSLLPWPRGRAPAARGAPPVSRW